MNGLNNGLNDGLNNGLNNGLFDGNLNGLHNGLNSSDLSFDIDALKFFQATGITNQKQITAVNFLVKNLKLFNLWNKRNVIYPFVGGTASTHKWNLKNVFNRDVFFRIVFYGGLTHDSNGVTGNGTNGYFDTYVNDAIINSLNQTPTPSKLNNIGIFAYTNNNIARGSDALFSTSGTFVTDAVFINPRNAIDQIGVRCQCTNFSLATNTDSRGFFGLSRYSSTFYNYYKNNLKYTSTEASTALQNTNYYGLYGFDGGAATTYSQRNICYLSFGLPLSDEEYFNYYRIVQQYQTILGRQV